MNWFGNDITPEMDQVARTFSISVSEIKKADAWYAEHQAGEDCPFKKSTCPLTGEPFYMGAIGGGLSYRFTDTSLGTAVTVICGCGAEKNVTDYETW